MLDTTYLVDRAQVSMATSLLDLDPRRIAVPPTEKDEWLIVGDPLGDLPQMREAATGVATLARKMGANEVDLLLGSAATEDRFKELYPKAEVIHLATHGVGLVDSVLGFPLVISAIRLSGGDDVGSIRYGIDPGQETRGWATRKAAEEVGVTEQTVRRLTNSVAAGR